jgi:hypothetical protein
VTLTVAFKIKWQKIERHHATEAEIIKITLKTRVLAHRGFVCSASNSTASYREAFCTLAIFQAPASLLSVTLMRG